MIHDSFLPFWIEGRPKPPTDSDMPQAMFYLAESGFERAMGITLMRGRFLTDADREGSPVVIDIDDRFARAYFPNEDPIGRHVNITQFNVQAEIVGVVGHVMQWGPGGDTPVGALEAQFFYPFMQMPEKLMAMTAGGAAVVLRTYGDPVDLMKLVRRGVEEIDRRQIIYNVQTMEEVIAGSLAARRLSMILLGVFAGLALLLACVGIYGVISYLVGERTREIGIRMALGAQRRDVVLLVVGHGAKMALIGVVVGIAGAMALTRLMQGALFGVSAHDPLTFSAVAVVLLTIALAASFVPARRAVRIDPGVALRRL
jgi:predicted permease